MSPDGELLCCTSHKKLDWYIRKGLGDVIAQNPFTVQLKFEPKGSNILLLLIRSKSKQH